ncbi:MAG: 16S rRNA (guanine(527)-N(7))-methyltransferase RsmG [Candidatus Weimeria sp.]
MNESDFLIKSLIPLDLHPSDDQVQMFLKYYQMLVEKNKVMNLTTITDYKDVVIKHFADSLSCVRLLPEFDIEYDFYEGASVIDVGTGAGFPGIPLKIMFPQIKLTLLDSLNKRVDFLKEVCAELGFSDVTFIHARAEDAARDKNLRESFNFCVSRAVANLSTLSEYCLPFVKTRGYFISYKSEKADQEIADSKNALSVLGGRVSLKKKFTLPDSDISRTIILIKKDKGTPKIYPRKAGTPLKKPL